MIVRGQVSNVVQGIPTDCPTREKHGWLGDAASTAEEAMFNFDVEGVFEEFLMTVADNQNAQGDVPGVVPVPTRGRGSSVATAAAARAAPRAKPGLGDGSTAPPTGSCPANHGGKTDISWSAAYPLIAGWLLKHYNNVRVAERHWPNLVEYMDGTRLSPFRPLFVQWGKNRLCCATVGYRYAGTA